MAEGLRTPITAGRMIDGRYMLRERIGAGGMAEVWRAHDEHLDRDVAIKVANSSRATDAPGAEDEARMAARLVHPNIVRVYDVGTDDGLSFVVMELISGTTLSQWRTSGAIDVAVDTVAQLADALEHAHREGVIHCDVKPQNVIVTGDGTPKLVDFGISRRAMSASDHASGEFLGSLPYVAPEQIHGGALDGRTDVYALGAVLFELLTGQRAFPADTVEASLRERLTAEPPSARSLNSAVSASLDSVVQRALETDPAARFQSAGEFRDALHDSADSVVALEAVTERYPRPLTVAPVIDGADADKVRRRFGAMPMAALTLTGLGIAALVAMFSIAGARNASPSADPPPVEAASTTPEPTAEPTKVTATTEPTRIPATAEPAVQVPIAPTPEPPRSAPPAVIVPNSGPAPQPKVAPGQEKKDEKKDEKKPQGTDNSKRGRD